MGPFLDQDFDLGDSTMVIIFTSDWGSLRCFTHTFFHSAHLPTDCGTVSPQLLKITTIAPMQDKAL